MSSALQIPSGDVAYWELESPDDVEATRPVPGRLQLVRRDESDIAAQRKLAETKARFEILADELEEASAAMSSTRRAVHHPAYVGVLALGEDVIPFLLQRLETSRSRPILLRLLGSLTAFQPGAGRETVAEAAAEWIRWGRREGRIR